MRTRVENGRFLPKKREVYEILSTASAESEDHHSFALEYNKNQKIKGIK